MSDEAALRAAIQANPDDDAPRLVLADLLTSRGDPHGELIVLMCGPQTPAVEQRVHAMLRAGWKAYAGELAPYANAWAFERGFVARVAMTIAAFVRHGAKLFGAHPVTTLHVTNDTWTPDQLEKLARAPALAKVRTLSLGPSKDPLAPLGTSKQLQQLRELKLSYCGHSAADWTALFEKLDAPKLEHVRLQRSREFPDDGAIAAKLALRGCKVTRES